MDRRQKLASFATSHAGCSSVLNVEKYVEACIRPVDRAPRAHSFYFGNPTLSTCSLVVCECYEACGSEELEFVDTYLPPGGGVRDSMVDVQVVARRCGAWVPASKDMSPPSQGDVWIITNDAGDAHAGICTADAVAPPNGSWTMETVEGGQMPLDEHGRAVAGQGSSAVAAFAGDKARHLAWNGSHWMMGQRYLLGYASAGKMPVPDDNVSPDETLQP